MDAEQRPTREQRAERQPSPPVEAEADERLAELQLARANEYSTDPWTRDAMTDLMPALYPVASTPPLFATK